MKEKQLLYRLSILWEKNLYCQKIIFVDFSDTEVNMKAFINGESGRSWKQFISNFDVFILDSLPCHRIHTYVSISCFIHFFSDIHCISWWSFCFCQLKCQLTNLSISIGYFHSLQGAIIWTFDANNAMLTQGLSTFGTLKLPFILLFRPMAIRGTLNVRIELLN